MTQHLPCVLYHADHEPKTYTTDGEVEAAKKAGWQDHPVDKSKPESIGVHTPPTKAYTTDAEVEAAKKAGWQDRPADQSKAQPYDKLRSGGNR